MVCILVEVFIFVEFLRIILVELGVIVDLIYSSVNEIIYIMCLGCFFKKLFFVRFIFIYKILLILCLCLLFVKRLIC